MFAAPASREVPWDAAVIYQVDERVAPAGDPSRSLTHLTEALGSASATVLPTPVNDADLTRCGGRVRRERTTPSDCSAGEELAHTLMREAEQRADIALGQALRLEVLRRPPCPSGGLDPACVIVRRICSPREQPAAEPD